MMATDHVRHHSVQPFLWSPMNKWQYIGQALYICSRCRALVFIAHGIGEYMGRYELLAQELADNGILVFSHDHGRYVGPVVL